LLNEVCYKGIDGEAAFANVAHGMLVRVGE
jgi:hypothetical protein